MKKPTKFAFKKTAKTAKPEKAEKPKAEVGTRAPQDAGGGLAPEADFNEREGELKKGLSADGLKAYEELSDYYRRVFLAWLTNGYNQSEAARTVRPTLTPGSARVQGWCIIHSAPVMRLRAELAHRDHQSIEQLKEKAIGVELAAMEAVDAKGNPDHMIRLRAARQVRLFALRAGPLFNVNLNMGGKPSAQAPSAIDSSPIADLLNMKASKAIKDAAIAGVTAEADPDAEGDDV